MQQNRSVAIQIWIIGALAPAALFFVGDFGKHDFALLWAAAKLLLSGNAESIYSPGLAQVLADGWDWGAAAVFPYPPHALFFFLPFALVPYIPAYLVWNAATAAFFVWTARPFLPERFPPVLTILTPAALTCFDFGQTGFLMGGLWFMAFRGKWWAVAFLTFKPHLGFLSILSLRGRKSLMLVVALSLALVVASGIFLGWRLWPAFIEQAIGHGERVGSTKRWLFAGVAPAMAYGFVGWVPFALAGALMLARKVNIFTAATASFLISPFGFHYDMTVASLGFGVLIFNSWNRMPMHHRIPIALGFLSPAIALVGAWWIPPLLLWSLWTQIKYDFEPPSR
ncbi:DUF2029 domain-containing protein [Sphingomonas sp. NSE70-1]|uniref:DUF2029 domain-containing protein n=1 Tax=Sphingomonas caseinilyticus TaxID=2908205 RepID=A0ABT0RVP4_9SPHN|nr:glycosyltransferase family 87 protein [Sphingomonas caseinilyticus]MCL6698903.1 DUF2029 domain-containing protein [Sphingomonas caseinilyticus]